ncbi:MAG: DUF4136 domain-containing protein [Cyclobacteriaceae bacterium]
MISYLTTMKNVAIACLLSFALTSCLVERDAIIESDYSYKGKFKKYRTFNFLNLNDTVNFNGLSDHKIKHEIERRLAAQGYKLSDKPSFYIAYKVYGEDFTFRGYEQLDLANWEENYAEYAEDDETLEYISEAQYKERSYQLSEGTLLIDFIDSESSRLIWQGYASGLFSDESYFSKDIRYSVRMILNEYRIVAANYKRR